MHQVDPFAEIMDCLLDAVMHEVDPFAEIMDCLLDAVMHQVGHVPNYNIQERWSRQINAITDAPPPLEEVTRPTSETGFQAEAINDDQARRRTFEWVQTVEPPLSFPDLPLKASQFYSSLGHFLSSLDWPNIEAESQYWAHQSSVTMMAQTTNHIRIAEGLEAIMEGRFCVK